MTKIVSIDFKCSLLPNEIVMASIVVRPESTPETILDAAYSSAYGQFRSMMRDRNIFRSTSLNRLIVRPISVYPYSEEFRHKFYYHRLFHQIIL